MKNLLKSLAAFQQECPVIHKGTSGYGYTYADLPAIFETINPLLSKHNLGFTQLIDGQDLKTILFHTESGETLETVTTVPQGVQLKGMNEFQVAGSSITYFRRYALSAMLGIVTDKDTDAQGEQVKPAAPAPAKPKAKPAFTADKFEAAYNANATVEKIKQLYTLTPEVEKEWVDFVFKKAESNVTEK
jgi:hypothetical protein